MEVEVTWVCWGPNSKAHDLTAFTYQPLVRGSCGPGPRASWCQVRARRAGAGAAEPSMGLQGEVEQQHPRQPLLQALLWGTAQSVKAAALCNDPGALGSAPPPHPGFCKHPETKPRTKPCPPAPAWFAVCPAPLPPPGTGCQFTASTELPPSPPGLSPSSLGRCLSAVGAHLANNTPSSKYPALNAVRWAHLGEGPASP